MRKRGHCITLYIISLIAITLGVGLCIGVPCYLHSTFHVNRQYNKIVQRVNKEISATHINEDISQIFTCIVEQEEECIAYAKNSKNILLQFPVNVLPYTFNFQGIYLMPQYQMSKQQLQFFIKLLLNIKDNKFIGGDDPILWQTLMNLESSYSDICTCWYEYNNNKGDVYKPCNELDSVGHAVDMLFEEGHYCALDSDNNTIFSDKTIEMMEKFVEL